MPNDVLPGEIQATLPVHGGRAPTQFKSGGNSLPLSGIKPPVAPAKSDPVAVAKTSSPDFAALAARLNQFLRESGRAISFQIASVGGRSVVQEVNPDTGEVLAEITSDDFLSLAHGLGLSGLVINSHA